MFSCSFVLVDGGQSGRVGLRGHHILDWLELRGRSLGPLSSSSDSGSRVLLVGGASTSMIILSSASLFPLSARRVGARLLALEICAIWSLFSLCHPVPSSLTSIHNDKPASSKRIDLLSCPWTARRLPAWASNCLEAYDCTMSRSLDD